MNISIPRRLKPFDEIRSKKLAIKILEEAGFKILKLNHIRGKGIRMEAEKWLSHGRLHAKISNPNKIYQLHVHFDHRDHFSLYRKRPSIQSCKEIGNFVKKYIEPNLLKNRFSYWIKSEPIQWLLSQPVDELFEMIDSIFKKAD